MGRMMRAVMVFGAGALLVGLPREDYSRLWTNTQTTALRAYALLDRHIVKPIQIATTSQSTPTSENATTSRQATDNVPDIADVPKPRPAIRPSLLGEAARRGLEDVRIPDVTVKPSPTPSPTPAPTLAPTKAGQGEGPVAPTIDIEPARPVAVSSDAVSAASSVAGPAAGNEASDSGVVIAKADADASQTPMAMPVAAVPHGAADGPHVPLPVAAPPAEMPQAVSAIEVEQDDKHAGVGPGPAAAGAATTPEPAAETAGSPPLPSEKPEVPADKKPPPAAKLLFGAAKTAAPLAARSIGFYSRGCLAGAKALPVDGPAWQAMRLSRNRNWGHPTLIALIERFAKDVQKYDGWSGLLVGDMSQPRGGPMLTGHASHQVGLDVDIWFTPMPGRRLSRRERENLSATSMILGPTKVDPTAFTPNHVRVVKRAASYPQVERILVHPAIKKALCEAAGTDRAWLGKVRPYFGHYYHFHMRIGCPKDSTHCRHQPPPSGDDGCGKELDNWFRRLTRPAPPKPKEVKPRPPKPPITLADMPKECAVVLEAGGGPSTRDEAELVKTSIERSKKIIDISGEPRAKALQRKAKQ